MRFLKLSCALCLVLISTAFADISTTTRHTLKRDVTPRSLAMGGASVAHPDGAERASINPATLGVPGIQYSFISRDFKVDTGETATHGFSGIAHHLYYSPFGISHWSLTDANNEKTQVTSFAYGRRNRDGISWGLSYKLIDVKSNTAHQTGWSTDLGLQMNLTRSISAGFVVQDFISDEIQDLDTSYRSGLSWTNESRKFRLNSDLTLDQSEVPGEKLKIAYGASYYLSDGFRLRGGWGDAITRAGVSLELPMMTADFTALFPNDTIQEKSVLFGISLGAGSREEAIRRKYALFKRHAYAYFAIGSNMVSGGSEVSLFGGQKIGTNDLLLLISEARKDKNCSGFVIRLGGLHASLGTLAAVQEIKAELVKAKQDGKHIIVYIDQWAMLPEYYLATVADTIVMPELGTLSHLGLEVEVTKTIGFLEKFGFEENVIASGKHKDAFVGSQPMSKADRELIRNLMYDLFEDAVKDIRKHRNLDWAKVKHVFDGRLISANEAKELGLIDKIGYWQSVKDIIKEKYDNENLSYSSKASIEPIHQFVSLPSQNTIFSPFNRIAVIEIDGAITMGENTSDYLFGGKTTGADYVEAIVDIIERDRFVKGVVVRINSPGGSMMAADRIYQALQRLKAKKIPVYTSMGVTAASGGYYIAMGTDKIYANPMTLTGSIGVISTYRNKSKMNGMLGFEVERFETGQYMGLFSQNKELTPAERKMLEKYQSEKYQYFTEKLAKDRELDMAQVKQVAQGQLITGADALDYKLIDELGGLHDAVADIAKKSNVIGTPEIRYYRPEPRRTLNLFDGTLFKKLIGF